MKTHGGGTRVGGGFYWNRRRWMIVPVAGKDGVLPGGDEDRYSKIPALVLVPLAPVMGGLFVMFLPLIGFVVLFGFAGVKALAVVKRAAMATRELAWKRT